MGQGRCDTVVMIGPPGSLGTGGVVVFAVLASTGLYLVAHMLLVRPLIAPQHEGLPDMGGVEVVLRSSPERGLWGLAGALLGTGVCLTLTTVVSLSFLPIAVVWLFLCGLIARFIARRATLTVYRDGFLFDAPGLHPVHLWWEDCTEFALGPLNTVRVRVSDAAGAPEPTVMPAGLGGHSADQLVALLDSFRQIAVPLAAAAPIEAPDRPTAPHSPVTNGAATTAGGATRVITTRWEGVVAVVMCAAVMVFMWVVGPARSTDITHPVLAFLAVQFLLLTGLCGAAVLVARPPRVELDEWGLRVFDPFLGSYERSWDDCGPFRYALLGPGYVYMDPGYNPDTPRWVLSESMLPIVVPPYDGMRGKQFAELLNRYRQTFATNLAPARAAPPHTHAGSTAQSLDPSSTAPHGQARQTSPGEVDWLTLDPPPPNA